MNGWRLQPNQTSRKNESGQNLSLMIDCYIMTCSRKTKKCNSTSMQLKERTPFQRIPTKKIKRSLPTQLKDSREESQDCLEFHSLTEVLSRQPRWSIARKNFRGILLAPQTSFA